MYQSIGKNWQTIVLCIEKKLFCEKYVLNSIKNENRKQPKNFLQ